MLDLLTSGFGLLFVIYLIYWGVGKLFYERLSYGGINSCALFFCWSASHIELSCDTR